MSFGIPPSRAMEYDTPEEEIEALCKNNGKPMLPGAKKRLERNVYQKWAERDREIARTQNSQIGELRASLVQQLQPGGSGGFQAASSNDDQNPPTRPASPTTENALTRPGSPAANEQPAPRQVTQAELFEGTLSDIEDDELTEEEEELPEETLKIKIPPLKRSSPGMPWNATSPSSGASAKGKEKEIIPTTAEMSPRPLSSSSSRSSAIQASHGQAFTASSSTPSASYHNSTLSQSAAPQPIAGPAGFIAQPAARPFGQGSVPMATQGHPASSSNAGAFGSASFAQASQRPPASQPEVFGSTNTLSAPKSSSGSFVSTWPKAATSTARNDVAMDAGAAMGSGITPARPTLQHFGFPPQSQARPHANFGASQPQQQAPPPTTQPKVFAANNAVSASEPTTASTVPAWPKPASCTAQSDIAMDADAGVNSGVTPANPTLQDFGFPQPSRASPHTNFGASQPPQQAHTVPTESLGLSAPAAAPAFAPASTLNSAQPSPFTQPRQQQPQQHHPQPSPPPQQAHSVEVEMGQDFAPATPSVGPMASVTPQWPTFSHFSAPSPTFMPQAPSFGTSSILAGQHQAPPLFAPLFQQPAFLQGTESSIAQPPLQTPSWTPEISLPEIPVQRTECALLPLQPEPPRPDILGLSTYSPPPSPPQMAAVLESTDTFEVMLARENEIHSRWQTSLEMDTQNVEQADQKVEETMCLDAQGRDPYKLIDFRPREALPESEKRNIMILEDQRRRAARAEAKKAARLARKALKHHPSQALESLGEREARPAQQWIKRKDKAAKPYDRIQVRMSVVDRRESKAKPKTRPWGVFGLQYA